MDLLLRPTPSAVLRQEAYLASETLGLGCLYRRHDGAYVRLPVHLRQQDGAYEWHSQRLDGRLARIAFTCEALEDWTGMAQAASRSVVELYRDMLRQPAVAMSDLFWAFDVFARTAAAPDGYETVFREGDYNPLNAWNTVRGAVHRTRRRPHGKGLRAPSAEARRGVRPPGCRLYTSSGRDVTADTLRVTRRDPMSGAPLRIEFSTPPDGDHSLEELLLSDGQRLTAPGLAGLLDENLAAFLPEDSIELAYGVKEAALARALPSETRTVPGGMVAAAMLRQAGMGAAGRVVRTA
jgi:hypothetical protein